MEGLQQLRQVPFAGRCGLLRLRLCFVVELVLNVGEHYGHPAKEAGGGRLPIILDLRQK